jgi:tRNA(Ile2) C34 agmatinyltransferase TiaS
MSAALATPAPVLSRPSGATLESRLDAVLAEGRARERADCPVCGGEMANRSSGSELRCEDCGSRLR